MHHEQDIWKMGDLRKKMPVTFWTFLIGTLALSGIPPFSGFYSQGLHSRAMSGTEKLSAFRRRRFHRRTDGILYVPVVLRRFLRQRKIRRTPQHAHESPLVMTLPLVVLAVLAAIGGFIGITNNYGSQFAADHETLSIAQQFLEPLHAPVAMLVGIGVALAGIFLAFSLYKNADDRSAARETRRAWRRR